MFGAEAESINLVTGNINEQINAIDNLNRTSWENNKQEHREAIEKATDFFTDNKSEKIYAGLDVLGGTTNLRMSQSSYNEILEKILTGVKKEFPDIDFDSTGFANVDYDPIKKLKLYRKVFSEIESASKDAFGNDYYDHAGENLNTWSDKINKLKEDISKKQPIFDTDVEGTLKYTEEYSKIYEKMLAAKEKYNEGVAGGDNDMMLGAVQDMEDVKKEFLNSGWDDAAVNLYVKNFFDQFSEAAKGTEIELDLKAKLSDDSDIQGNILKDVVKKFEDENGKIDLYHILNVGADYESSGKASNRNAILSEQEQAYVNLKSAADQYDISVEELVNALTKLGYAENVVSDSAKDYAQEITNIANAHKKAIDLANNMDAKPSDYDEFIALGKEYADTLEWAGDRIEINSKQLDDLTMAKKLNTKASIEETRAMDEQVWIKKAAEISILQENYDSLTDKEKEQLGVLEDQSKAISENILKYQLLVDELNSATSGYSKWMTAKEAIDPGYVYDDAKKAFEAMKEGFKSGKTGTSAFEGAMEFLVPDEVIAKGTDAVEKYVKKIKSLFKDGADGMQWFLDKSVSTGLATYLKDGSWKIKPGVDTEDFVNKLGMTKDLVLAVFGELEEYEYEFNFDDENTTLALKKVQELIDAKSKLNSIKTEKGIDSQEYKDASDEIKEITSSINEIPEETLTKIGVEIDPETKEIIYDTSNIELTISSSKAKNDIQMMIEEYRTIYDQLQQDPGNLALNNRIAELKTNLSNLDDVTKEAFMIDPSLFDYGIASMSETLNDYKASLIKIQNLSSNGRLSPGESQELKKAKTDADELRSKLENIPDIETKLNVDMSDLDNQLLNGTFDIDSISVKTNVNNASLWEDLFSIDKYIQQLQSTPVDVKVNTMTTNAELDSLQQKINSLFSNPIVVDVDTANANAKLGAFQQTIDSQPAKTISIHAETAAAQKDTNILFDAMERIKNKSVDFNVDVFGRTDLDNLKLKIDSIKNKTVTIKTVFSTGIGLGLPASASKQGGSSNAYGTPGAKKTGTALVGEIGREIKVDRESGTWKTIGDNGPEFINVKKGDVIFNNKQTEDLLRNGNTDALGEAYLNGTAYVGGGGKSLKKNTTKNKKKPTSKSNSSSNAKKSSNKSASSNKSSSDKNEVPWQEELKNYQHLRAMELITDQEYYNKLHSITQRYYASRNSYLDEYRSILEEEFQLSRSLAEDWFNDQQHKVTLLENKNAPKQDQIAIYKKMQAETHRLAEEARKYGLDDNSEYIQSLQTQWFEYAENIKNLINEIYEERQKALENLSSLLENQNNVLVSGGNNYKSIQNLKKQMDVQTEIQENAHKEAQRLRALGVDENDDAVQACISAWWDAENQITDIAQSIADTLIGEFDSFISYMDDFDLWGKSSLSKIDYLTQKLAKIKELFASGLLTYKEYIDLTNETTLDLRDLQKDALDEIIDKTMDMIKQEAEDHVDALEEVKEKYSEIVDLEKESLRISKEQEDHHKSVRQKLKDIADLESRITKLKLDDSREATAERLALEKELAEKNEDLADYQADYQYDAQVEALDKSAEAFSDAKDEEIKVIEESVNSTTKLYNLAIERIDKGWDQLYTDLLKWNSEYGDGIDGENSIASAWRIAQQAANGYKDTLSLIDGLTNTDGINPQMPANEANSIISKMRENSLNWYTADSSKQGQLASTNNSLASKLPSLIGEGVKNVNGTWVTDSGSSLYSLSTKDIISHIVNAMKSNGAAWSSATSESEKTALSAENNRLASMVSRVSGQSVSRDGNGVWWIGNKKLFDSYHSGGIAGNQPTLKQNEVMAVLEKGEPVLDAPKEKGLYKIIDFIDVLSTKLGKVINLSPLQNMFSSAPVSNAISNPAFGTNMRTNQSVSLAPVINVNIRANGEMTDSTATRFGEIVAESTLSKLTDAFHRRGFGWKNDSSLK